MSEACHGEHAEADHKIDLQARREREQVLIKGEPHDKEEIRSRDFKFHIKSPEFVGTLQAKEFIDWLNQVKRFFFHIKRLLSGRQLN